MIVTCQNCYATYNIDEKLIDIEGRKVKCVKCGYTWIQYLTSVREIKKRLKPKAKGLDWVVTQSSIKETKHIEKEKEWEKELEKQAEKELVFETKTEAVADDITDSLNLSEEEEEFNELPNAPVKKNFFGEMENEINLNFIKEEPEVYDIPELPEDEIALIINKQKRVFKKNLKIILTIILLNFLWFGRFKIVETVPQTRIFYNILHIKAVKIGEGLSFKNITRRKISENNQLFLEVRGYVINSSLKDHTVHQIDVQLYDENGNFLKRTLTDPEQIELAPNRTTPFIARLENPPKKAAYIIITFKERF